MTKLLLSRLFGILKLSVYLGIIVTDDDHQNVTASGWNGDAAQIIVEPTGERKPENDHFRYNFTLGNDGTLTVNNEKAVGQGLKQDHVTIARDGLTTIYEIMFPSSEFGLAKFEDGMSLGLGICVNDGDGTRSIRPKRLERMVYPCCGLREKPREYGTG